MHGCFVICCFYDGKKKVGEEGSWFNNGCGYLSGITCSPFSRFIILLITFFTYLLVRHQNTIYIYLVYIILRVHVHMYDT